MAGHTLTTIDKLLMEFYRAPLVAQYMAPALGSWGAYLEPTNHDYKFAELAERVTQILVERGEVSTLRASYAEVARKLGFYEKGVYQLPADHPLAVAA